MAHQYAKNFLTRMKIVTLAKLSWWCQHSSTINGIHEI